MSRLIQHRSEPLVYLITDRRMLPAPASGPDLTHLIDFIARAMAAGVDMVQIRERDLSAREITDLSKAIAEPAQVAGASILINERADIAAATGAGVHLTTRSMTAEVVRRAFEADLLVGASTHSFEEACAAERGGADFIVFGPVFETADKKVYGEPVGVEALGEVAAHLRIPVLALGGISLANYRLALDAGAAGVAGISMFSHARDLRSVVETLKGRGS